MLNVRCWYNFSELASLLIHVQSDDTAANTGAFTFVPVTELHTLLGYFTLMFLKPQS